MTAAEALEPFKVTPTESQLLDVLYEVLAQGVPPKGRLTVEDVERFLHEHARAKKSVAEMLTFFEKHGLPTEASAYGADPMLGALANGLHKERGPISATFSLGEMPETQPPASESGTPRRIEPVVPLEDTAPRARVVPEAAAPVPPKRGFSLLGAVSLGCVVILGGALFATFRHAQDLSLQLNQARMQQRTTDQALTTLEQRAETLKGFLERSEADRRTLANRFDSFIAGEAQQRAAEEAALERLLGPRYETLRDKALQQAQMAPTP